jgi:amino acid permease
VFPAPQASSRASDVVASSLVLLSTMVGGGTLTLPYAFCQMGLAGGVLLQLGSGVAAGFSLYILVASARRTGAKTYAEVNVWRHRALYWAGVPVTPLSSSL